ncbi:hypothetical protein IL306_008062 [Fusarium sp. DS 682]|nr:hypothetical protein IL306_008062 [Fusarium sp. DS 682]
MASNTISEARFEEIRKAVGRPLEVSPSVYMQRLREETSKDDSLSQFLKKASKVDLSPRQTPEEWLQKLATIDFTNTRAITNLSSALVTDNMDEFNLGTNGDYTFVIAPYPEALSVDDTSSERSELEGSHGPDIHPALVSLEIGEQPGFYAGLLSWETPQTPGAARSLPSLVLPVGQLLKRRNTKGNVSDLIDTDYVLVVDAVTTGHPVWLIFYPDSGDELKEEVYVDPMRTRFPFEGMEMNFNAAQVFPSVQDWIQSYGNLDFTQLEEAIQMTEMTETTGVFKAKNVTSWDAAKLLGN